MRNAACIRDPKETPFCFFADATVLCTSLRDQYPPRCDLPPQCRTIVARKETTKLRCICIEVSHGRSLRTLCVERRTIVTAAARRETRSARGVATHARRAGK